METKKLDELKTPILTVDAQIQLLRKIRKSTQKNSENVKQMIRDLKIELGIKE